MAATAGRVVARVAVGFALAGALVYLILQLADWGDQWVQADYLVHLPYSLANGIAVQPLSDLGNALRTQALLDDRSRILAYWVIALDQKIRLALLDRLPLPPAAGPLFWLLHLVLGPLALLGYLRRVSGWLVAVGGLAVYLSSAGFLHAVTMNWLPQKALVGVVFLLLLWNGATDAGRRATAGRPAAKRAIVVVGTMALLLAAFFLDEYGYSAPALLVCCFWWRFLPDGGRRVGAGLAASLLPVLFPVAVFLAATAWLLPTLAEGHYGVDYSFFSHIAAASPDRQGGAMGLAGAWLANFGTTLFQLWSVSSVPFALAPADPSYPTHFGMQAPVAGNLAATALVVLLLGAILVKAQRETPERGRWLCGAVVAYLAFVAFISLLSLSHEPRVVSGFYYGASAAPLLAIVLALALDCARGWLRPAAAVLLLWVTCVQLLNFDYLNRVWSSGSDAYQAELFAEYLPLDPLPPQQPRQAIRDLTESARLGALDRRLEEEALPARLLYLFAELCARDPDVSRRCPALLEHLQASTGSP